MHDFIDSLQDNPIAALLGAASVIAIIGGVAVGAARGSFRVDPQQSQLEARQQSEALRQQSIKIANQRFDDGCEGVFYARPGSNDFSPLADGSPVLNAAYWKEYAKTKRQPSAIDYLPAGTVVCDVYGNAGILKAVEGKPYAVISDITNTPDRDRIHKMMSRYPGGQRHNVGAK